LEDRILLNAASPVAAIDIPAEDFINENFNFGVTFDNAAAVGPSTTGFAPYVDVVIPQEVDTSGLTVSYLGANIVHADKCDLRWHAVARCRD